MQHDVESPRVKRLFAAGCAGMFVFGVVLALLGTLFGLPEMRARMHVDLAQQGNLFFLLFLGVCSSTLAAGPLIDNLGHKLVLLWSSLLVAGGLLGYFTLDRASGLIPYVLVFASSGFIYIAVSDLMPQMQRRATVRETIPQVLLIALGVVLVLFLTSQTQTHGH